MEYYQLNCTSDFAQKIRVAGIFSAVFRWKNTRNIGFILFSVPHIFLNSVFSVVKSHLSGCLRDIEPIRSHSYA